MGSCSEQRFAQLFSTGASAYAEYRPTYPPELYDTVLQRAQLTSKERRRLAVDLACGSGQATLALASHFDHVIGLDANERQLAAAPHAPNIKYKHGDANATGLPSASADLVTVAQGLHWFDLNLFFKEAARLLKPHGALAAWTYPVCTLVAPGHAANAALMHIFEDVLGPYWSERRALVDKCYEGLEAHAQPMFGIVERFQAATLRETKTVADMVGYVRSWSSYNTYRQQHPDLSDPAEAFQASLMQALGPGSDPKTQLEVITPMVMLLAREPRAFGGAA